MPENTFREFVQFLKQNRFQRCVLRGNEPALHPEIKNFVAITKERGLRPLVETTGTANEEICKNLAEAGCEITARVYHPDVYPEDRSFEAVLDTLKNLKERTKGGPLDVRIFIDDVTRSYAFINKICQELAPRRMELELSALYEPVDARSVTSWVMQQLPTWLEKGTSLQFGCFFPPCAFTDDALGQCIRLNISRARCAPKVGIRPDGMVYHCRRMTDCVTYAFSSFNSFDELLHHMYVAYRDCQFTAEALGECQDCLSLSTDACIGKCMLQKRRFIQDRLDELESKSGEELTTALLFEAGRLYLALHCLERAESYLLEARRSDPEDGNVHLLLARLFRARRKHKEAREEYMKAARLLPDNEEILAEASREMGPQRE